MPRSDRPHWRSSPELQARARELRREATPAERRLWQAIGGGRLAGAHFRRQHAVGPYIVDFFCAKAKLVVEIDGDSHAERRDYDARRTEWLTEEKGYRVVRFTNREVLENMEGVVFRLRECLDKAPPPQPSPAGTQGREPEG